MEGVWFAYDATTGRPIYQRVKVIDRTEHPPLQPGKPVDGLPVVARRPQLLAGLVRPAARTTSSTPRPRPPRSTSQAKLTPTQKKRKFDCSATSSSGSQNGNFGTLPARLARPRLDQRDRRQHRPAGLEVHDARARARRRHDDRQRARLRRRRRRRPARVRPEDRQGPLDVPDRPPDRGRRRRSTRSTARSTSRSPSAARRRRRAAAPRASSRSSRSAAPQTQSPPPPLAARDSQPQTARVRRRARRPRARVARSAQRLRHDRNAGRARRAAVARELVERRARPGRVLLNGAPVAGARVVARRLRRSAGDCEGRQLPHRRRHHDPARHVVRVVGLDARDRPRARAHARAAERAARGVRRLQRRLRGRTG